jgi:O-antigen/teichoic acid export membrane protein
MAKFKQNSKLMAKNSAFMYIQMGVRMLIGLYTVRVILHALGGEDYGIYNVVGGFVTMFSFITETLVSASQRFFAYSIGRGEKDMLNRYFNTSLLCFLILGVFMLLLIEGVGYWFVNYKMIIPDDRLEAANWVLQFSIFSFIVRVITVPYSAMVVSHEKLAIYAVISVLDSFLLLGIALLLQSVSADRLKIYALGMFGISLISSILYILLCKYYFKEDSRIKLKYEAILINEMLGYSGWYMFGTLAMMVRSQGINMVLNLFFGPIVNAARGIAFQINNALNQFVNSFYNAVRPQITKMTASENNHGMISLVFNSSLISFFLMSLLAVPLIAEMPFVLSIWLSDYPEHTVMFSRLVIITALIDTLGYPLTTAVCASGRIKWFQIVTGVILTLNLPLTYFLFKIFPNPDIAFYVSIGFAAIAQVARMFFMNRMFGMSNVAYVKTVLWPALFVFVVSISLTFCLIFIFGDAIWMHLLIIVLSVLMTLSLSFFVGMNKQQRCSLVSMLSNMVKPKNQ